MKCMERRKRLLCLPHKLTRTWKEIGRPWKFLEHFVKNDKLKEFLKKHMDLERSSNKTFFMWDGKATSMDSLHWMNLSKWRVTTQCSVFDSFWQYKQTCRATNCHNIFEQGIHTLLKPLNYCFFYMYWITMSCVPSQWSWTMSSPTSSMTSLAFEISRKYPWNNSRMWSF